MRRSYPGLRSLLPALLLLGAASAAHAQRVLYVNHAATGANDGASWADAFTALQDALSATTRGSGDEVWVAQGTYRPDQGQRVTLGDRAASFRLKNGVALYGGFAGTERTRDERDWETNETVLSGDLLGNDNDNVTKEEPTRQDNSIHVVTAQNVGQTTMLDGFTVRSGNAIETFGGGMSLELASPVVREVVFESNAANHGAGLYIHEGDPLFEHILFVKNRALSV